MLITQRKVLPLLNFHNKVELIYLDHKMHIVADSYIVLNEISRCGFGSVHLGTHVKNREVVALKFIPTNVTASFNQGLVRKLCAAYEGQIDLSLGKLPAEFVYASVCRSPEVVRYDACYIDQGCWAMVMEFAEGFSVLRDHVIAHGPLDLGSLYKITKQLAVALNTCVVNGVDHRGLSVDNILYNPKTKEIKLVGFGHATALTANKEPYKAPKDKSNLPPEAIKFGSCSPLQTLVWRFGALLRFCMLGTGRLSRLASSNTRITSNNPIEFLIKRCLDEDPRTRILFSNLQKHVTHQI